MGGDITFVSVPNVETVFTAKIRAEITEEVIKVPKTKRSKVYILDDNIMSAAVLVSYCKKANI